MALNVDGHLLDIAIRQRYFLIIIDHKYYLYLERNNYCRQHFRKYKNFI